MYLKTRYGASEISGLLTMEMAEDPRDGCGREGEVDSRADAAPGG